MKPTIKLSIIFIAIHLLSSCTIMPYKEESACNFNDLGKCIAIEDAYIEAKTGITKTAVAINGSKTIHKDYSTINIENKNINDISKYHQARYNKIKSLIVNEKTPLLEPPVVRKVLILPHQDNNIWYEAHNVFYIEERSQFILSPLTKNNASRNLDIYQ